MVVMKRLAILAFCGAGLVSAADPSEVHPGLTEVHNVYLLKMSKGFDQYLANHLTGERIFQVVTDPKLADTLITEQIGETFEAKMGELYPPPETEKQRAAKAEKAEKAEKAKKASETDKKKSDAAEEEMQANLLTDTVNKLSAPGAGSFGRAKGMVFLVDAKTKQVIWSAYDLPRDATSKELDRA